jgi:hypothetical protein
METVAARKFQVTLELRSDAQVDVQTDESTHPSSLAVGSMERAH